MKWSELTRSTKPLDWRAILERVSFTPDKLNRHLAQLVKQRRDTMNTTHVVGPEDVEPVDVDETAKVEDSTIEDDDSDDDEESEIEEDSDESSEDE